MARVGLVESCCRTIKYVSILSQIVAVLKLEEYRPCEGRDLLRLMSFLLCGLLAYSTYDSNRCSLFLRRSTIAGLTTHDIQISENRAHRDQPMIRISKQRHTAVCRAHSLGGIGQDIPPVPASKAQVGLWATAVILSQARVNILIRGFRHLYQPMRLFPCLSPAGIWPQIPCHVCTIKL